MIDQNTDLIQIAKRDHNKKRNYLVMNRLQGKHIPAKPDDALGMFAQLAECLEGEYDGEKTLVIGFAETATAIGAAVAVRLGAYYIQTTREDVAADYLYFSEEHSHATQQRLVKQDLDQIMPKIDKVVFAEDEITTGHTIQNLIQVLTQEYPGQAEYAAASVLNGMDQEALQMYQSRNIRLYYLVKTEQKDYAKGLQKYIRKGLYIDDSYKMPKNNIIVKEMAVEGRINARRLTDAAAYEKACEDLWHAIEGRLHEELKGRILVLGTEEFMYPPLYAAQKMAEGGAEVLFHATTRSPIEVYEEEDYPLHVRYELPSLYDKDRRTFIYDIGVYDLVLIITDACVVERDGLEALIQAAASKNDKIYVIRWC